MNLKTAYEQAKSVTSDINEHIETLRVYASECRHVTEFGTREGVSTIAFISAIPDKVIAYDVVRHPQIVDLENMAEDNFVDFKFIEKNVLDVTIEETDLLFIDTLHTYEQLSKELIIHGNFAKKYIICHDTETFGNKSETGKTPGLWLAINNFIEANKHWHIKEIFHNNNGLVVMERI